MHTAHENDLDLDLLRRIADEGGIETVNGRFPAPMFELMRRGFVKECAVGAHGYVCWRITQRGLDVLC